jgi:hypothetical protein
LPEIAVDAARGRCVDDAAVLLLEEVRPGGFGALECAAGVSGEDGVPEVGSQVCEGFVPEDTGVVYLIVVLA